MAWLEIFNFLHFVGLAFGLGGATIASIISAKADKDIELGKVTTVDVKGVAGGKIMQIVHTGIIYEGRKAIIEVFNDITERKAVEDRLEKSRQELEKARQELQIHVEEISQNQRALLLMLEDANQMKKEVVEKSEELKKPVY